MLAHRVPLAWKNLTYRWDRLLIAAAGVGFAVVLMFMQTGFQNALFDSTVEVIKALDADVVIVSSACYSISSARRFPRERLQVALTDPQVRAVSPIYLETFGSLLQGAGDDAGDRRRRPIRSIGFDIHDRVFVDETIARRQARLAAPMSVLFDRRSKDVYGVDREALDAGLVLQRELSGQSVRMTGVFELSTDFANEGNLLMSQETFARLFPYRVRGGDPLQVVDIGLVRLAPGADATAAQQRLRKVLPGDVFVLTKEAFIREEIKFWNRATPIGMIFSIGVAMGFLVGAIICYQIIFTDLNNHMSEFATLKAMGYAGGYFTALVLWESFYLSLFGYLPGLAASLGLYWVLRGWTGLLMRLTLWRAVKVFLLTLLMCVASGAIAIRKLRSADPASLF